jgi:hypothetical protein
MGSMRSWWWGAALAVLVVAVYRPSFDCGWIWDDAEYALHANARDPGGLVRTWTQPTSLPQWYPLLYSSYWLEHRFWGDAPAGYHIVNVLLHALAAVLLWRVLLRLRLPAPASLLAAALFALRPVQVGSVAWVAERKNTLSMLLYLSAGLAYLRFDPLDDKIPWAFFRSRWWWVALVLFAAAMLSKTVVLSWPAAWLLLVYWRRGRIGLRDVSATLPFFAMGIGLGLLTAVTETTRLGATGAEFDYSLIERCLIAGRAAWFYAVKLLWPAELMTIYPRWQISGGDAWAYLYPVALLAALAGFALLRKRIGRGPMVAALLFVGTLLPALGFFNVASFRCSFVADHFLYHASPALLAPASQITRLRSNTPSLPPLFMKAP